MLSHWMPYGLGPRQCIGMRFAQMEMKACIVNLLRRFEIRPANASHAKPSNELPSELPVDVLSTLESRDPSVNPIAGIHQGPTLSPEGGVHVVLVARTHCPVEHVESITSELRASFEADAEKQSEEYAVRLERRINQLIVSNSLHSSELHQRLH
jgi:hypothetical protein